MEAILVTPRSESAMNALQSFLKEMQGAFTSRTRPETLEAKITRLYAEGHYTDAEMRTFFGIPKKHRTDPFDCVDDGDIYWADRRNIAHLDTTIEENRREREKGNYIRLEKGQSVWDLV